MSDRRPGDSGEDLRVEIDPEPTDEEFVAILQALRELQEPERLVSEGDPETNWQRIARREALRSAEWPPQRLEWSAGRR